MHISRIELAQFRSHHDAVFEFGPGVTVISGPNGSGKTNLLEAIYVIATGSSFRDRDEHLTEYNRDWWKITATLDDQTREVRYHSDMKQLRIGDKTLQRFSTKSRLPIVLFEPDDLMMIHGTPSGRRKYVDRLISGVTTGYTSTLRRYERIIAQRNALLRTPSLDHDALFVLDIMLAEHADTIVATRREVIKQWNQTLSANYSQLAGRPTDIHSRYQSHIPEHSYKQSLITALKTHLERDRLIGTTSLGPHRDDLEFMIDQQPFVTAASRGEIRSLVLSLVQFEAASLQQHYQSQPILLLDDVFSELDVTRQHQITEMLSDYQIIITSTHRTKWRGVTNIALQ